MKKITFIITLVIIFALSIYNVTYAFSLDNIMSGADDFISAGQGSEHGQLDVNEDGIKNVADMIYNTLFIIAVIVAVIVAAFLGIKFMTSAVEEQAKIKESLIPFVVGCIVIFGAFAIWKLVTNILAGI